jgi:5'-nucleotidase
VNETLVLGVDLDGVCANYEDAFRAAVARQHGRDPADLPPQTVLDQFTEWGLEPDTFAETHRRAVTEDRMFRHMAPMPGVSEALWELSDVGVWIRIITHRLCVNWAHEVTAADTAAWLDEQRIPYRDLCFIGAKPHVGADIYVEDSPANVIALRESGRHTIVFDQPYNGHLPGPRAYDWTEVGAQVRDVIASRGRQARLPLDDRHD